MGLKRGHKPPTAKPKIRPVPKKAGVVGRLCTPGGEECVAEDSREAA